MKIVSICSFTALLLMAGCSHYSDDLASLDGKMPTTEMAALAPQDVAPAAGAGAGAGGISLTDALAREYYDMAKFENDQAFDYKAAKIYTHKAMQAAEGKNGGPFKISAFDVTAEQAAELTPARAELIAALKNKDMLGDQAALAKAQTSFDCWVERAEEAADENHYAECKNAFEQSMAVLAMPAAGVAGDETAHSYEVLNAYNIVFAANSASLDDASKASIDQVAGILNAQGNAAYTANLTAFTNATSGEFAKQLAAARAASLRSALAERGVDLSRVIDGGVATATQDGSVAQAQIVLNAPVAASANTETTTEYVPAQ